MACRETVNDYLQHIPASEVPSPATAMAMAMKIAMAMARVRAIAKAMATTITTAVVPATERTERRGW